MTPPELRDLMIRQVRGVSVHAAREKIATLKTLKIDPALASSIMLTTVTGVVGFFILLGLAVLAFHYFPPA
jgi:hypothetical protein